MNAETGASMVLVDSTVLMRKARLIGLFLMVWGGLFGGIPLFIAFGGGPGASNGQVALMVAAMLGMAAFFGGLYLLLLRGNVRYDAAQGMIEQQRGLLGGDVRVRTPSSAVDRVCLRKKSLQRGGSMLAVTLEGPSGIRILLGDDYGDRQDALLTALRAMRATGLPLLEESADGKVRRLSPTATPAPAPDAVANPGKWWRRPSALALLLANLVPLGGVLFADWQVLPVMLLFWLENVVIGAYTLARMLLARGSDEAASPTAVLSENLFVCAFFVVHYGAFTGGHGLFLTLMFGPDGAGRQGDFNPFNPVALIGFITQVVVQHGLFFALLALVISHGVSFVVNYLVPRAYEEAVAAKLMFRPYGRVVVLHIVILVGGFAAQFSGEPLVALVLLVVLKIVIDLAAHLHEHRREGAPAVEALAWVSVPAPAAAPAAAASSAPVAAPSATAARLAARQDLNDQPLAHYLGAWESVPGQAAVAGWFGKASFDDNGGRLRLRLIDAESEAAPVELGNPTVRGNAERVEYIEVRLLTRGRQRILRFTASGTDPNGLDLSELQHPEGNPKAMQAKSFALRRRRALPE